MFTVKLFVGEDEVYSTSDENLSAAKKTARRVIRQKLGSSIKLATVEDLSGSANLVNIVFNPKDVKNTTVEIASPGRPAGSRNKATEDLSPEDEDPGEPVSKPNEPVNEVLAEIAGIAAEGDPDLLTEYSHSQLFDTTVYLGIDKAKKWHTKTKLADHIVKHVAANA